MSQFIDDTIRNTIDVTFSIWGVAVGAAGLIFMGLCKVQEIVGAG